MNIIAFVSPGNFVQILQSFSAQQLNTLTVVSILLTIFGFFYISYDLLDRRHGILRGAVQIISPMLATSLPWLIWLLLFMVFPSFSSVVVYSGIMIGILLCLYLSISYRNRQRKPFRKWSLVVIRCLASVSPWILCILAYNSSPYIAVLFTTMFMFLSAMIGALHGILASFTGLGAAKTIGKDNYSAVLPTGLTKTGNNLTSFNLPSTEENSTVDTKLNEKKLSRRTRLKQFIKRIPLHLLRFLMGFLFGFVIGYIFWLLVLVFLFGAAFNGTEILEYSYLFGSLSGVACALWHCFLHYRLETWRETAWRLLCYLRQFLNNLFKIVRHFYAWATTQQPIKSHLEDKSSDEEQNSSATAFRPPLFLPDDGKMGFRLWLWTSYLFAVAMTGLIVFLIIHSFSLSSSDSQQNMLIIGAEFALIAGLAALTVGPAAGWFAAGITQFTNWSTYHTSGKRLGAFGFALTLLAFSLQLVGPLATLYNTTITDVTFTRHSSPVKVVAWSPDGEYIASADSDTIFIWNATTKQVIGSFDDQSNTITSLAWSPDGKHLALSDESDDNQSSYTTQGTVQIEAIPNSTSIVSKLHTVYIYHSSASYINSVSWSPNGTQVLIADANGNNTLWNWGDIRKHKTWNDSSHWFSQAYQCPLSIAYIDSRYSSWSPDGTLIATACPNSGLIHIWSAKTGNGFDFPQQNSNVNSISWSPDGKSIASVTYNSQGSTQVKIWNIVMGTNIFTYDPPQSPQLLDYLTSNSTNVDVNSIAWSSDGSRLVAALTDGRAIVWDAFTGGNTITYNGFIHDGNNYSVNTVAWCPYGNRIASGGDDNTVRIWETQ